MKWREFWRTPRTMLESINDRSVTFLELFFDLVFVVYIATINHMLLHHFDVDTFIHFLLLFGIGWWAWYNGSSYHELHGNDDIRSRYFTFIQMFFMIGMIIFAPTAFDSGYLGFSIAFICFNLVIAYLWFMTGIVDKNHRSMSVPYTSIILFSTVLFIIGIFVESDARSILWVISIGVSLLLPTLMLPIMRVLKLERHYNLRITHSMSERFGLFVIIVTGEILVGVVNGFGLSDTIQFEHLALGLFGFIIAVFVWWNYFDFLSLKVPKEESLRQNAWAGLHFPLAVSVSVLGTLITLLFEAIHHHEEFVNFLNYTQLFVGITLAIYGLIAFNLQDDKVHKRSHQLSNRVVFVLGLVSILLFFIDLTVTITIVTTILSLVGTIGFAAVYLLKNE